MTNINIRSQIKSSGLISLFVALWLIVAPSFFNYANEGARISDMWIGLFIVVLSIIKILKPKSSWLSWVIVTLGVWLVFSPILIAYVNPIFFWNDVFSGLVVLSISLWDITEAMNTFRLPHKNPHRLSY